MRADIPSAPLRSSDLKALALITAGALVVLAVWVSTAHACSCIREHAANTLARSDGALVGVVESVRRVEERYEHVIRVQRALKGELGERVTVESSGDDAM